MLFCNPDEFLEVPALLEEPPGEPFHHRKTK
jgi:hypothetical protein